MDGFLVPALALVTLVIVAILAFVNKKQTEAKLDDPTAEESSLARDTPDPQFKPDSRVTHQEREQI